MQVTCPYCGERAKMVKGSQIYGAFCRTVKDNFWVCWKCNAYVGTHKPNKRYGFDGTEPLGRLADKELRRAKIEVHRVFDPLWKDAGWSRQEAYEWLATRMGIAIENCHVGMFDLELCEKAAGILQGFAELLRKGDAREHAPKSTRWSNAGSGNKKKKHNRIGGVGKRDTCK